MSTPANPVFTQTGGARIGRSYWLSFNATWPFAKLEVTEAGITITVEALSKTYSFAKANITDIWLNAGILSTGVQIEHCIESHPKYIVFWTSNIDEMRSSLHRLGYKTR